MDKKGFSDLTSLASEREEHRAGAQAQAEDEAPGSETASVTEEAARTSARAHQRDDDPHAPRGFAGLSSLSANASTATPQHGDHPPRRERPRTRAHSPASARPPAVEDKPEVQNHEPMVPLSRRSTKPRPSFAKWIVLTGIGIAAVFALTTPELRDEVLATIRAATGEGETSTTTASARAPKEPRLLEFSRPPVGRDNVLSVSQIRWCVRESITIETLRTHATTNLQIAEFNGLIADYNNRCGSYRYRRGTLERARHEVELMREEIGRQALARWHQSAIPNSPTNLFGARFANTSLQKQPDTPTVLPGALAASTSQPSLIARTGEVSTAGDDHMQKLLDEGIEYPRALRMVAEAYERGDVLPNDPILARFFYWNAAREGDVRAQLTMALMVMEGGHGFPQDDSEAARWTRLAAEQGDRDGQFLLGVLHRLGTGVPRSDVEAARWFRLAAEQGHQDAQGALGDIYFEGTGVQEDYVSAYAWWSTAASQGHEQAAKNKTFVAERMTNSQISKAQSLSQEFWQLYVLPFQ